MTDKTDITLTINGRKHAIRVEPRKTLVDAIRDECGQTGTHIGCEHGVCGACTVILDDEAVRSCLMFAVQAAGRPIRTVEGLADGDTLSPLQQPVPLHRLPEHHQGGEGREGRAAPFTVTLRRSTRSSRVEPRRATARPFILRGPRVKRLSQPNPR